MKKSKICKFIALLMVIFIVTLQGCSWKAKPEKSAQELIDEGNLEYDKGNYQKAVEAFEKLKDWYPFSKYAITAELKTADSYYQLKEYDQAAMSYEEFETLHPSNEVIPYIVYQLGRCYFDRIDTIDRDQTNSKKALQTFNRLVRQFPDNQYSILAKPHINKCRKSLAEHEFYVGKFYYKSKKYKAALYRFKGLISNYPDVGVNKKAIDYIKLCEDKVKESKIEN
ncbi:MAG: outer membrane protein assembly factor BamD [Desulfobacterales bacterium]|nr:outer membrane protein assembly factor BamD [Desulfobacterales bacterium]